MAQFFFMIETRAVPKKSTKSCKGNGGAVLHYADPKSKDYERFVSQVAALTIGRRPMLKGALRSTTNIYFKRPKSVKAKYHTVKPDVDNCLKALWDGLKTIAFKDDCQFVSESTHKHYSKDGRDYVTILIEEME